VDPSYVLSVADPSDDAFPGTFLLVARSSGPCDVSPRMAHCWRGFDRGLALGVHVSSRCDWCVIHGGQSQPCTCGIGAQSGESIRSKSEHLQKLSELIQQLHEGCPKTVFWLKGVKLTLPCTRMSKSQSSDYQSLNQSLKAYKLQQFNVRTWTSGTYFETLNLRRNGTQEYSSSLLKYPEPSSAKWNL